MVQERASTMRFARLIADYSVVQARLRHSIIADTSIATRLSLMRQATALMDRIENHDPIDAQELRCKIAFFLERARRGSGQYDMNIALSLAARAEKPGCETGGKRSAMPHEVLNRLVMRGASPDQVKRFVLGLDERASLLDKSLRYCSTSKGNANFHGRSSRDFNGQHVTEVIGMQRFVTRGKRYMEQSLSGRSVSYYYSLQVPVLGMRVMQCFMRPWHADGGTTEGLMMWVDDVTDRMTRTHGFEDLPAA